MTDRYISEDGETHACETGMRHTFRCLGDTMTVTYLIGPDVRPNADYPRYVLESSAHLRIERTPKDDLVPGDGYLQLRFEGLGPGQTYTLTRHDGPDHEEVLFADASYENIVDRPLDEIPDYAARLLEPPEAADTAPEADQE